MNIQISEIQEMLTKAAVSFVSEAEAKYFAESFITEHLRKSHHTDVLASVINDLKAWKGWVGTCIVENEKPASFICNLNGAKPSLKIKEIHDTLEKKAKTNGIAFCGIKNGGLFNTLGVWTDGLAKRGMLGIAMYNGGPFGVVPFGGSAGIFGTNPFAFSIPTSDKPVTADFATSEYSFRTMMKARSDGERLSRVGVTTDGIETDDPNNVYQDLGDGKLTCTLHPLGGNYKGYAFVYLLEVMTGALIGSKLSTEMDLSYIPEEHGGVIIAIDVALHTNLAAFAKSVEDMNEIIRKQVPGYGYERVTVPGDRGSEREKFFRTKGVIDLDKNIFDRLNALI